MEKEKTSKTIATLLLGIVSGIWIHNLHVKTSQAGREAFMAQQAQRWNYFYSRPHSTMTSVIACIGACVVGVVLYEVTTAGIHFLLRNTKPHDGADRLDNQKD